MTFPHDPKSAGFGLAPGELRLVPVGPEWAARFDQERHRIAAALAAGMLDIQHIGSTAVPGIMAKPILDIAAAIDDFESGRALVSPLTALGYIYHSENGIPRRHFFVREGTHHLHIFERSSWDWKRHLLFRDRLRANPQLATQYSQIKLAAAIQSGSDRDRYQNLKSAFIERTQNT